MDLLLECHDRIRSFLLLSRRLAAAQDPDGVAEAAARVVRYFTEALPLHARDEEESLRPRLAGLDPALDVALATMLREHAEHEAPLGALVAACRELARDPRRQPELAPAIARAADALDAHFVAHLRSEEEIVFPAVRRLLPERELAANAREIRERRGAGTPPAPR